MPNKDNNISDSQFATKDDVKAIVTAIINDAIDDFATMVGNSFADTQRQVNTLSSEFREFRAEMSEFKTEMTEFKSNMLEFKGNTEPVLYALQIDVAYLKTEMTEIKTRLDRMEWHHTIFT